MDFGFHFWGFGLVLIAVNAYLSFNVSEPLTERVRLKEGLLTRASKPGAVTRVSKRVPVNTSWEGVNQVLGLKAFFSESAKVKTWLID